MVDLSERELVERIQSGDAEAFQQLYEEQAPFIYRYIRARLGNDQDAEDLTAQVFVKAWRSFPSYEWQGKAVGAWLVRIAHNLVVDKYRKKREWSALLPWAHKAEERGFERVAHQDEIQRALPTLSYEQQVILHMRFLEGYSLTEIADFLEKTPNAVRVAQFRALKRLRKVLGRT